MIRPLNENEFRRIGPPGTGKTTWLARQAQRAVESHRANAEVDEWGEYADDVGSRVLIATLTKGAASELRSRGVELPPDQISTLHSHAFRALGSPKMAVGKEAMTEWNEYTDDPRFQMKSFIADESAEADAAKDKHDVDFNKQKVATGDDLYDQYSLYKATLTPRAEWSPVVSEFADRYESWKSVSGLMDFTDLIHAAYDECESAPGKPETIFIDEAQDHDAAELRLVRKWAAGCEKVVLVGDPDQTIYRWRGADPQAFFETPIPEENERVLGQSYRIPSAVHDWSMRLIRRVSDRKDVEFLPRVDRESGEVVEGEVRQKNLKMFGAESFFTYKDAERNYLSKGKSVMFLATCSHMLNGIVSALRREGVPFWNPYTKRHNGFNPLHPSGDGLSSVDAFLAYLIPTTEGRLWKPTELLRWVSAVKVTGTFNRGSAKIIKEKTGDGESPVSMEFLASLMKPEALTELDESNVGADWFISRVKTPRAEAMSYIGKVYANHGAAALADEPQVTVGTIHSVKGGEADAVYMAPDLTTNGMEAKSRAVGRNLKPGQSSLDDLLRLFYVGATRAKESLILCRPKNPNMSMF